MIKEHRKNEKEQKKLLDHLRIKFNEEGKQLEQIAKSKRITEVVNNSKIELTYEVYKPKKKSSIGKLDGVGANKMIENNVFEEKNLNLNHSEINNSSHLKVLSRAQSTN